ncbi:UDP-N-acetylglucosamine diphosphorylase/glucosamine-1-phosphate N-acetyltransferase [Paraphotobacterium marinum]|uniref:Bifunctional protein GlmU n=1 Tax=Paraphotobacterium marinum TaxID=1755811 RepID=A0A220VDV5_9GAMM|nr:bifunctional UDP-N-acetylglucosamine diphosphorylase/glucosamine-1-phosphate N-acetyltransferase GlmU [Paraphotobacterium marinum]ASK78123.1 UDP-N-acetylglucosamine diphosphorylase/glucosamine-1-phosphate N-acetyltransferase [Paraphotobacterium marinum]
MDLNAIILAAGKGTRMKSNKPKVLHELASKPMVNHVIDTCKEIRCKTISVVYGYQPDMMKKALEKEKLTWIYQKEQLGTGHAVQIALNDKNKSDKILVLYGDVPLITKKTINRLIESQPKGGIAFLTCIKENPKGFGRICKKNELIEYIVEEKDANSKEKEIKEINTGVLVADAKDLALWLSQINNNNAQREYYLTDIVKVANNHGRKVVAVTTDNEMEVEGVNSKSQLSALERTYQSFLAKTYMDEGLEINDPTRFDVRGELTFGQDVFVDNNVIFEGRVSLGNNVRISSNCIIRDSVIDDNTEILSFSSIEESKIGSNCIVGPYARLRPQTKLKNSVKVGNFVEIKKTTIDDLSKVNHLSYIGDTSIGKKVNIGAGTITCNYDGVNKFQTEIEDDVFIGSNSSLRAPLLIKNGSTIGAGSVITKNVSEKELVFNKAPIVKSTSWVRPKKIKDDK